MAHFISTWVRQIVMTMKCKYVQRGRGYRLEGV